MSRGIRRLAALAVVLALGAAATAAAEVTLETSVSKVQRTLDDSDRIARELVPVDEVVPGEELRYTITFRNDSGMVVDAERIVITNPIPDGTVYVSGSAGGDAARVEYSVDGDNFTETEPQPRAAAPATAAPGSAEAGSGTGPAADEAPASPVRSLRWIYQAALPPGESGQVFFHVIMQ